MLALGIVFVVIATLIITIVSFFITLPFFLFKKSYDDFPGVWIVTWIVVFIIFLSIL